MHRSFKPRGLWLSVGAALLLLLAGVYHPIVSQIHVSSPPLRVREADGSPSTLGVRVLEFDQAVGFTVTPLPGGVARISGTFGAAPGDADYWVGTANAQLTNEIVVNNEASLEAAIGSVNLLTATELGIGLKMDAGLVAFSPEEIGTVTWLNNANHCWEFDIASTGVNPGLCFSDNMFLLDSTRLELSDGSLIGWGGTTDTGIHAAYLNSTPQIRIVGERDVASQNVQFIGESYSGTNTNAGFIFRGRASRGTMAAPSALQSGDEIFRISMGGYKGDSLVDDAASIIGTAVSNWTTTAVPTEITFITTAGGFAPTSKIKIQPDTTLQLLDPGAKPTCSISYRGSLFFNEGAAGIADTVEICSKDAADAYAWRTLI